MQCHKHQLTPWPSWLRRATVNRKIVSSILTGVGLLLFLPFLCSLFHIYSEVPGRAELQWGEGTQSTTKPCTNNISAKVEKGGGEGCDSAS